MNKKTVLNIVMIWLAWVVIIIGLQNLASSRFSAQLPDRVLQKIESVTDPATYQIGHPYLLDPLMNNQVAWDSEYFIGIANGGYDDPQIPRLAPSGVATIVVDNAVNSGGENTNSLSLAYAFFPFYPWMMWLVALPLRTFINPIGATSLAGVIISAIGALGGMLAIYDITCEKLDENGAMRAVFYLIIFPSAFFLIQVYSEGLFIGLSFGCLALLTHKRWGLAGLLGACAALTRPVGVALVIPMVMAWVNSEEWRELDIEWRSIFYRGIPRKSVIRAFLAFTPLIAFLIWKFSYLGFAFDYVESYYFKRGFLEFGNAFSAWYGAIAVLFSSNPQRVAYFLMEDLGLVLSIAACVLCIKRDPELAWYSLAVLILSWGSGQAQGMLRFVLTLPVVFVTLARWGKNPVFDRAWTLLSILLMGLLATLFAFNFWVG
jgi:hypothetical protein